MPMGDATLSVRSTGAAGAAPGRCSDLARPVKVGPDSVSPASSYRIDILSLYHIMHYGNYYLRYYVVCV